MGRGHACRHASLLADLDTRHSKPFRGIGHPRIYAPTNQRQVTELCHCALEAGVSQAVVEKAVDAADAKGDLIGLVLARRASHIQGSLARSLCTIAHPLDTKFTNKVRDIFGAALSEAAVRPGPRRARADSEAGLLCVLRGGGDAAAAALHRTLEHAVLVLGALSTATTRTERKALRKMDEQIVSLHEAVGATWTVRALPGRLSVLCVSTLNIHSMAVLYGLAGRLTAENGGFRPRHP